jgi:transposase
LSRKRTIPPYKKIQAVEDYLNGKGSQGELSRRCSVCKKTFQEWIRQYQLGGAKGLCPAIQNKKYSLELKHCAVRDYFDGKGSLGDVCAKYRISSERTLRHWIDKRYNCHEDLKQPNSGGAVYMTKGRKTTLDERIETVSFCIANNKDYGKAIQRYGVSYQQIYGWVRKYEKDGVQGLADRRGKCKDKAFMSEVEKLQAEIKLRDAENLRLRMENDLLKKLSQLERGRAEG